MLERRQIAHRIIDSPDFIEPEWRKKLMHEHHTLIEERSMIVNRLLLDMPANVTGTDERYERIKARTVAHVRTWMPELEKAGLVS